MTRLDFYSKNLPADIGASITMALVAVPDAIASAILAGVNPTYGFNALIVGTPIGSLFTSSQYMNIGSTAAMMLKGLPLGGSLGGTSIMLSAGAKSRWANVFMGLFVAVFVFFFADQVEKVALPAIAAVLIVAGFGVYKFDVIKDIWDVSRSSRIVMLVTFLATLTVEIQEAVFIGIILSILDYVYTAAQDVQVMELVEQEDGLRSSPNNS